MRVKPMQTTAAPWGKKAEHTQHSMSRARRQQLLCCLLLGQWLLAAVKKAVQSTWGSLLCRLLRNTAVRPEPCIQPVRKMYRYG
jgi:hypothetical protein